MKEKVILTLENGDDVVLLLKGSLEFVEETSVSHANKSRIGDLCSDIITNTTGDYDYR